MWKETVLIVEDDIQIRNFIAFTLEKEGYRTLCTSQGGEALELSMTEQVDLLLLDMGLPDMDGRQVLDRLREWSDMPVIIVSARDQEQEKVNALDMGADDYLTKPFAASELLARIRVALRHYFRSDGKKNQDMLKNGGLELQMERRVAYKDGEEIHLTKLEYSLLQLFLQNQGKVLTYGFILRELYGKNYGSDTQALRALMAGLRRKIEKNPAKPEYITTEIGVGYRMLEQ